MSQTAKDSIADHYLRLIAEVIEQPWKEDIIAEIEDLEDHYPWIVDYVYQQGVRGNL